MTSSSHPTRTPQHVEPRSGEPRRTIPAALFQPPTNPPAPIPLNPEPAEPDTHHQPAEPLPQTPFTVARAYTEQDLKNNITATDLAWLHQHPLLWLRALTSIRRDVGTHIAKDQAALTPLKPTLPGEPPTHEYMAAKRDTEHRSRGRLHFLQLVDRRREEVASLLGDTPAHQRIPISDLLHTLTRIQDLLAADNIDDAEALLDHTITRWAHTGDTPTP